MNDAFLNLLLSKNPIVIGFVSSMFGAAGGILSWLATNPLSKQPKSKRSLVVIVCVVIFLLAPTPIRWKLEAAGYTPKISEAKWLEINSNIAEVINKQTPIRIDNITALLSAEGTKTSVVYHYRVETTDLRLDVDTMGEKLKSNIVEQVCARKEARYPLDLGDTYTYNYADPSGALLAAFSVTKADCPATTQP